VRWSVRKIPANKGRADEYRLVMRDLDGIYSRKDGSPEYILSNLRDNFFEIEKIIRQAEAEKKGLKIDFIRKFGRKFINWVEIIS